MLEEGPRRLEEPSGKKKNPYRSKQPAGVQLSCFKRAERAAKRKGQLPMGSSQNKGTKAPSGQGGTQGATPRHSRRSARSNQKTIADIVAFLESRGCTPIKGPHGPENQIDSPCPRPECGGGRDRFRAREHDGKVVFTCRKCTPTDRKAARKWRRDLWQDIDRYLGQGTDPRGNGHTQSRPTNGRPKPRPARRIDHLPNHEARYDYHGKDGNLVLVVLRFKNKGGKKSFAQYQPSGNGFISKGLAKSPPYRLPELLENPDKPVLLVEGEKATDRLQGALGRKWEVSTWAGGTPAWKKTDWTPLEGRKVVIVADADPPGRKAATDLAQYLSDKATVRLALLEGATGTGLDDVLDREGLPQVKQILSEAKPPPEKAPPSVSSDLPAPDLSRSFEIGKFAGRELRERGMFCYVRESDEILAATPTHWRSSNLREARIEAQDHSEIIESLKQLVVDAQSAEDDDDDGKMRRRISMVCESAWKSKPLTEGLYKGLTREYPALANNRINTPDGVYEITEESYGRKSPVDLKTDFFRYCTPSTPDFDKGHEIWSKLVLEWVGGNWEVANYLQRRIGAALLRKPGKNILNFVGPPDSGKTSFARGLSTPFGDDMAHWCNEELFDPKGSHNGQLKRLLQLNPFIVVLDDMQDAKLYGRKLNRFSGNTTERARGSGDPYGYEMSGKVVSTLFTLGEASSAVRGITEGTRSRFKTIQFSPVDRIDRTLNDRLSDPESLECRGALGWALEGAYLVLANPEEDEKIPAAVIEWGKEELGMQDPFADWWNKAETPAEGLTATEIAEKYADEERVKLRAQDVGRAFRTMNSEWYVKSGTVSRPKYSKPAK